MIRFRNLLTSSWLHRGGKFGALILSVAFARGTTQIGGATSAQLRSDVWGCRLLHVIDRGLFPAEAGVYGVIAIIRQNLCLGTTRESIYEGALLSAPIDPSPNLIGASLCLIDPLVSGPQQFSEAIFRPSSNGAERPRFPDSFAALEIGAFAHGAVLTTIPCVADDIHRGDRESVWWSKCGPDLRGRWSMAKRSGPTRSLKASNANRHLSKATKGNTPDQKKKPRPVC